MRLGCWFSSGFILQNDNVHMSGSTFRRGMPSFGQERDHVCTHSPHGHIAMLTLGWQTRNAERQGFQTGECLCLSPLPLHTSPRGFWGGCHYARPPTHELCKLGVACSDFLGPRQHLHVPAL